MAGPLEQIPTILRLITVARPATFGTVSLSRQPSVSPPFMDMQDSWMAGDSTGYLNFRVAGPGKPERSGVIPVVLVETAVRTSLEIRMISWWTTQAGTSLYFTPAGQRLLESTLRRRRLIPRGTWRSTLRFVRRRRDH